MKTVRDIAYMIIEDFTIYALTTRRRGKKRLANIYNMALDMILRGLY